MAIQFKCPGCGAMIRVPDNAAGKKGTCPQCNEKLIVPMVNAGNAVPDVGQPAAAAASPGPAKTELPHIGAPHIDVAGKPAATQPAAPASTTPAVGSKPAPATEAAPKPEAAKVDPKVGAGLPKLDPKAASGLPKLDPKPETAAQAPTESGLPPLLGDPPEGLPDPFSSPRRAKKRKSSAGLIVPVICVLALVGFIGWLMWKTQPKLEGELVAHSVPGFEMRPNLIPAKFSALSKSDLGIVLGHLKKTPSVWASTAARFTMTSTDDGIEVAVHPGQGYHLVSVQTSQSTALLQYLKRNIEKLEKARVESIQKYAPKFYESLKLHFEKKTPLTEQATHRDRVLFPTLVGGLGYHLNAATQNGTKYPCVYEDSEGLIYFLLPNAAKKFTIQGRLIPEGEFVPANYTVNVEGASPTGGSEKKKAKPKTKEQLEAENLGMNPELYEKKDGADAGNDAMGEGADAKAGPGSSDSDLKKKSRKTKLEMMDDSEMPDEAMPGKRKPSAGQ